MRQRSSLLKAVITAFPSVSLPFLAVPLRSQPTVAIRVAKPDCLKPAFFGQPVVTQWVPAVWTSVNTWVSPHSVCEKCPPFERSYHGVQCSSCRTGSRVVDVEESCLPADIYSCGNADIGTPLDDVGASRGTCLAAGTCVYTAYSATVYETCIANDIDACPAADVSDVFVNNSNSSCMAAGKCSYQPYIAHEDERCTATDAPACAAADLSDYTWSWRRYNCLNAGDCEYIDPDPSDPAFHQTEPYVSTISNFCRPKQKAACDAVPIGSHLSVNIRRCAEAGAYNL
eukprot:SAG22_NODE_1386_length_4531_cov_153.363499_1_plen_284_part_10